MNESKGSDSSWACQCKAIDVLHKPRHFCTHILYPVGLSAFCSAFFSAPPLADSAEPCNELRRDHENMVAEVMRSSRVGETERWCEASELGFALVFFSQRTYRVQCLQRPISRWRSDSYYGIRDRPVLPLRLKHPKWPALNAIQVHGFLGEGGFDDQAVASSSLGKGWSARWCRDPNNGCYNGPGFVCVFGAGGPCKLCEF